MNLNQNETEEINQKVSYLNMFGYNISNWDWQNNQFCLFKRVIDKNCFVGTYTYSFLEFLSYLETEILLIDVTQKN